MVSIPLGQKHISLGTSSTQTEQMRVVDKQQEKWATCELDFLRNPLPSILSFSGPALCTTAHSSGAAFQFCHQAVALPGKTRLWSDNSACFCPGGHSTAAVHESSVDQMRQTCRDIAARLSSCSCNYTRGFQLFVHVGEVYFFLT